VTAHSLSKHFLFFLIVLALIPSSIVFGDSVATANLLPPGETSTANDEVILDDTSTYDVSENVVTVEETTETIGGQEVELTQEVKFKTSDGDSLTISNTALPSAIIAIPDETKVKAPSTWDGAITPPKQISTSGSAPSGFQTPTTSIQMGSPDVILVFDKAVTILLSGTTGQTAYKSPGTNNWILISGCTGTYANPDNPPANGECSISNGVDTKILTFHFTEFSGLSATPASTPAASTPSTSSGSSGGSGKTGVGSPRIFGSSGSSGGGYIAQGSSNGIPEWFDNVFDWYREGKITPKEFFNAYSWIVENVL